MQSLWAEMVVFCIQSLDFFLNFFCRFYVWLLIGKKNSEKQIFIHTSIINHIRSSVDVAFNQKPQMPGCMRLLPIQPYLLNGLFYTAITQGYAESDLYWHYTGSVDISGTLKPNHDLQHALWNCPSVDRNWNNNFRESLLWNIYLYVS